MWFGALSALSGILSAATLIFLQLCDVAAPELLGCCLGSRVSARCVGVDGTFYLFPGLTFGALFVAMHARRGRIDPGRAAGFIAVSGAANAVAVFLCVWLTDRLGEAFDIGFLNLPMALAGAIAGATGGASLAGAAKVLLPGFVDVRRAIVAAAALGLLVPLVLMWEVAGVFIFYLIWQSGYAVALASHQPVEV